VPPAPGLPWNAAPPDRFWLWSIQTALRTLDPLIVPDGRWTAWWRFRLRAVRVALGIDAAPGQARVSAALWNHAQVQAGFWANPWADGGPTEADLIERVVGMPTPRVGGPATRATSPAAALRRLYHVDVCLHHRGRLALAACRAGALHGRPDRSRGRRSARDRAGQPSRRRAQRADCVDLPSGAGEHRRDAARTGLNYTTYAVGVRGWLAAPEDLLFRLCGATLSPHIGEKKGSWRVCDPPNLPPIFCSR
jgi:hypothetical protein